jgi:hypothetical protein
MKLVREETNELHCECTEEELLARGRQLGKVTEEIEALDLERKSVASGYRSKIKLKEDERDKLAKTVRSGKELRKVECRVFADIKRACYVTVRQDTGEEVRSRPMSKSELEHERQADLPLTEKTKSKDAGGDEEKRGEGRPVPPPELLADQVDLDDQRAWLEEHRFPQPIRRGCPKRTLALLIAIRQDDYDEGAAEQAFGPLAWPERDAP